MNKKVCCTCEVVVLLIKPIALSSASLDLKLPTSIKDRLRTARCLPKPANLLRGKGQEPVKEREFEFGGPVVLAPSLFLFF